ncbi:hypothetical protein HXX76_013625 [Chlamydomonas incerta]|uniref:Protein kinase domain-containing protein n=1 Tax=Chlamydomonas incerta TaxID=51695 RepID=A0A835SIK2_CHLIN|nr:hypothetical protein HXX76_013625 [Chlamydomonas incerta]|eukprot:KAG2425582.1 hypothetical protein HXX76_013625 [Chlamydomonas incerta]
MQAMNCADVVRGYLDTEVDTVMVTSNINCTEDAWAGVPVPVPLRRNLTFIGVPPGPDGLLLTWNNNFIRKKVRLVNTTLHFKYFVTFGTRHNNQNLAPGYDLLAPCDPGDWGRLVVDSCFTVQRLCLPPSLHEQLRCWPHLGFYEDFALVCADLDAGQKYIAVGYTIQLLNSRYVCDETISLECVRELGTVGCYSAWDKYKLAHAPPLPVVATFLAPRDAAGGDSSQQGGLSATGQVLVGAIIGGVACAGLIIGAVVGYTLWRRRRAAGPHPAGLLPVAMKPDEDGSADLHGSGHTLSIATADEGGGSYAARGMLCPAVCWRSPRAGSLQPLDTAGCAFATASSASAATEGAAEPAASQQAASAARGCSDPGAGNGRRDGSQQGCPIEAALEGQEADDEGPEISMYDTVEVVTLDRPVRHVDVKPEVLLDPTVTLLPITLGRGAFGRVVEGRYQGQRVAVKLLNDSAFGLPAGVAKSTGAARGRIEAKGADAKGATDGNGVADNDGDEAVLRQHIQEALAQEVQVLGRCRHPNVLRLMAACITPPRLCLVMELMETSLERMLYGRAADIAGGGGAGGGGGGGDDGLAPEPLLPLATVLDIALDVAHGLSYLHPTIIHRDLKPGNVLVNMSGGKLVAKLADFGISRIASTILQTAHPEAGTPAFMAPELFDINNFQISHKVDVYSFGILLWSMLSGEVPWQDLTLVQMAYRVAVLQQRPPLAAIPAHRLPPKMIRLITGCWDHEPERRLAAAEIVKQLLLIKQAYSGRLSA